MVVIAAVREAEQWSLGNLIGALILLTVIGLTLFYVIRRYLRD